MSSWLQRVAREAGRWGNQAYGHTFGELGGWAGKQFGNDDPQHGTALGNYTRHLFNMSAGGAIPFGGPITGYGADYEAQRQLGNTEGRAAGIAGTNFGISLASMIAGEGGASYGGDIPGHLGYADWGSLGNTALDHLGPGLMQQGKEIDKANTYKPSDYLMAQLLMQQNQSQAIPSAPVWAP